MLGEARFLRFNRISRPRTHEQKKKCPHRGTQTGDKVHFPAFESFSRFLFHRRPGQFEKHRKGATLNVIVLITGNENEVKTLATAVFTEITLTTAFILLRPFLFKSTFVVPPLCAPCGPPGTSLELPRIPWMNVSRCHAMGIRLKSSGWKLGRVFLLILEIVNQ